MIQALRDRQTGIMLLAAMATSGAAWWLLLAGPSMAQMFVCGVDGFGPAGGAWGAGRLMELCGMWVAMAAAMMVPVGVLSLSGRERDRWGAVHPPLSCRTSPPQGGRLDGALARLLFAAVLSVKPVWGSECAPSDSPPLWGRCPAGQRGVLFGYLAFLVAASGSAAICQWTLESLGLIGEGAKIASSLLAGALLAVIGLWHIAQLLRRHAPCGSISSSQAKSLLQGWRHGCSSLGCCLTMVGLQFVAGAMNPWLMIGLTLWMLAEAFVPWKRELASATGIALLTAGGLTIMGALG